MKIPKGFKVKIDERVIKNWINNNKDGRSNLSKLLRHKKDEILKDVANLTVKGVCEKLEFRPVKRRDFNDEFGYIVAKTAGYKKVKRKGTVLKDYGYVRSAGGFIGRSGRATYLQLIAIPDNSGFGVDVVLTVR